MLMLLFQTIVGGVVGVIGIILYIEFRFQRMEVRVIFPGGAKSEWMSYYRAMSYLAMEGTLMEFKRGKNKNVG